MRSAPAATASSEHGKFLNGRMRGGVGQNSPGSPAGEATARLASELTVCLVTSSHASLRLRAHPEKIQRHGPGQDAMDFSDLSCSALLKYGLVAYVNFCSQHINININSIKGDSHGTYLSS